MKIVVVKIHRVVEVKECWSYLRISEGCGSNHCQAKVLELQTSETSSYFSQDGGGSCPPLGCTPVDRVSSNHG